MFGARFWTTMVISAVAAIASPVIVSTAGCIAAATAIVAASATAVNAVASVMGKE